MKLLSIRKRPAKKSKNGYTYQVYFTYKDLYGISKYYSKSGFDTKTQAKIHEAEMKTKLKEKGTLHKANKTFNEVYHEFMKAEEQTLSLNTIYRKNSNFKKHIENNFGTSKIELFKSFAFLQDIFNNLESNSTNTNDSIKALIKSVTSFAIKMEYIDSCPIDLVTVKGIKSEKKRKNRIVSFETFQQAYNDLDDHYAITIAIGYYTGMRIAEILGLKEEDIDFEMNIINVHRQLVYTGRNLKDFEVVSRLKTSDSRASIPLNNQLKELLLEYLKTHHNEYICQKNNMFFYPSTLERILRKKYSFSYHDLRHTFASTLYNNNVDVKTTQELLRHSNISTTLDVYTHLEKNKKLDTVNDVFKTKSVKNVSNLENSND